MNISQSSHDAVDWPAAREIRALLRCEDSNCCCHHEGSNVHCPAHDDKNPSLSVDDGTNASESGAKSIWHCHGGCSKENVTKALYERVFGNSVPTNTATSPGADVVNAAAKAFKAKRLTLRERGINAQTRRHFGIESYPGVGLRYPVLDSNGVEIYQRIKSAVPNQPKYRDLKNNEVTGLAIYNAAIVHDAARMKHGFYIVKSEFEVWVMYQCGLAAVCPLGAEQEFDVLVQWLLGYRIQSIHALFGNDVAGRQSALGLCEATKPHDVEAKVGVLNGPLGFDLSDLFCQLGFNPRRFRDEIDQLDFASGAVRKEWRENPEAGLPDPPSNGATEGDLDLLPCLDEDELAAQPLPECVIEGLLLAGHPTLFSGQQNLGKTALAYDFCLSISEGLPWNGRATKKGPTFFLAAEGSEGAYPRIQGWKQFHGIEQKPDFRVIPVSVAFDEPPALARLIRTLQHLNQTGNPTALVVIDTLALCLNEADENNSSDMTRFVRAATEICTATGAAVLIIHHNNRGNTYRGSSSLPANCYGHLSLDGNDEEICLDVLKIKDHNHRQRFWLRPEFLTIKGLQDRYGKPVTSVVFVPIEKENGGDDGASSPSGAPQSRAKSNPFAKSKGSNKTAKSRGELSEKEQATWQALLELCPNGAAGVTSGDWAASVKQQGVSGATFERAKKKLQELGKVSCDAPGKIGARFTPKS